MNSLVAEEVLCGGAYLFPLWRESRASSPPEESLIWDVMDEELVWRDLCTVEEAREVILIPA